MNAGFVHGLPAGIGRASIPVVVARRAGVDSLVDARAEAVARFRKTGGLPPKTAKPKKQKNGGGPSPLLVVGMAFAAGIVLAKVIDWRGHAHPRD